jgi:hypothetical protein
MQHTVRAPRRLLLPAPATPHRPRGGGNGRSKVCAIAPGLGVEWPWHASGSQIRHVRTFRRSFLADDGGHFSAVVRDLHAEGGARGLAGSEAADATGSPRCWALIDDHRVVTPCDTPQRLQGRPTAQQTSCGSSQMRLGHCCMLFYGRKALGGVGGVNPAAASDILSRLMAQES